jgi:iron-sulfur cluster insertion protein
MITVTEKAKQKVAEILQQEGKAGQGLRVAVLGGGCSGFTYDLKFDAAAGEGDEVLDCGSFRVFVDPISSQFLEGSSLDFLDGLQGTGFKVGNPNAKGTCGCGQSFSV